MPDIKRAYRKRSLLVHPDRNSSPSAAKQFEQLGLINKILRDGRRDRYDEFLRNGFPKWKGTGYFYTRYRPGLLGVLIFLVAITAAVERGLRQYTYTRDLKKITALWRTARLLACGASVETPAHLLPAITTGKKSTSDRKVRVPLGGYEDLPPLPQQGAPDQAWTEHEAALKRVLATPNPASNRTIDAIVSLDGQHVEGLVPGSGGERFPIDPLALQAPSWTSTWPVALVHRFLPRPKDFEGKPADEPADEPEEKVASPATAVSKSKKPTNRKKKSGK